MNDNEEARFRQERTALNVITIYDLANMELCTINAGDDEEGISDFEQNQADELVDLLNGDFPPEMEELIMELVQLLDGDIRIEDCKRL